MKCVATCAFLAMVGACCGPTTIESVTFRPAPDIKRVHIDSIDFYSDKNFTIPAPPHWYMDTSRSEIRTLIRSGLPEHGFQLVEDVVADADSVLRLKIDLYFVGGPFGVAMKIRTRVCVGEEVFLEITGSGACPSLNRGDILKAQREMANALIKEFAEKIQSK